MAYYQDGAVLGTNHFNFFQAFCLKALISHRKHFIKDERYRQGCAPLWKRPGADTCPMNISLPEHG
jgi:hypothetical protein